MYSGESPMTLFVGSALAVILFRFSWSRLVQGVLPWSPGDVIREATAFRAHDRYALRGKEPGHDVEDWVQAEREVWREAWLRLALGVIMILVGALVAFVVIFALLTLGSEIFGYDAAVLSRDLTRPEAVQITIGIIFAVLLLQWWPANWRPQLTERRSYLILGVLPAFVLLVPHIDRLMESLTKFKAAGVEVEFGNARAQSRPTLESERDKMVSNTEERLRTASKTIARDLHVATVRSYLTGSAVTGELEKIKAYITTAKTAQKFLEKSLEPLFSCARSAKDRYPQQHAVEEILTPVAVQLGTHLGGASPADKVGVTAADKMSSPEEFVHRAIRSARQELERRFGDDCASDNKNARPGKSSPSETQWPEGVLVSQLAASPHVHLVFANLLWFTGGTEIARDHLMTVVDRFPEDMNVHYLLAQLFYVSERSFEDIGNRLTTVLKLIDVDRERVNRVSAAAAKVPEDALTDLRTRYKLAHRIVTNDFAYWAAQAGVRELTASEYAEENYKKRDEVKVLGDVYCSIIDTYGYVKLLFGGRRRDSTTLRMVDDAQRLFEEAQACVREMKQETRADVRQRQALLKTFALHARQATLFARDLR